jgi:hypothetical protein
MKVCWINGQYTAGIIKLLYTKTMLQLSDCNNKPLCGKSLQAIIAYLIGLHLYPLDDTKHYKSLYLNCCQLLKYDIRHNQPTVATSSSSLYIFHYISNFVLYYDQFCSFKAYPIVVLEFPEFRLSVNRITLSGTPLGRQTRHARSQSIVRRCSQRHGVSLTLFALLSSEALTPRYLVHHVLITPHHLQIVILYHHAPRDLLCLPRHSLC